MSAFKSSNLSDRLTAQAAAKQAMLEKFRARPSTDDPEVARRQAERQALVAAREARVAERETKQREDEARRLADAAALAARLEIEKAERDAAEEAERKAREAARPKQIIRDVAAYAAMKAAGGRRR